MAGIAQPPPGADSFAQTEDLALGRAGCIIVARAGCVIEFVGTYLLNIQTVRIVHRIDQDARE